MSKVVNGVQISNFEKLAKTIKRNPEMGQLKFIAKSTWKGGTRAEVAVSEYYAADQNLAPSERKFKIVMDEPHPLGGNDSAPNPFEMMVAALCGCMNAGIALSASLAHAQIDGIEIEAEAHINVLGLLGITEDTTAPNLIHYKVTVDGPEPEKLIAAKEAFDAKSAVVASLKHPLNVTTEIVVKKK